jgi:dihydroorotate dehydrogenase electron transfer subunit
MRPAGAELVESREIVPGTWQQAWHAPAVVSGVRAGQYVHVRTSAPAGYPTRLPFPVATADAASGTLTIQVDGASRSGAWLRGLRPGDRVEMLGPMGRPFEVDARARHLLLVAEGPSIAGLRLLVDEAIRDGRSVAVLYGAASSAHVYPSSLLPDEVEYVVATDDGSLGHPGAVGDLVMGYEAWADQSFACGPPSLLARVAGLATGRRQRMGVATLGRKRGGGRPIPPGSPGARRKSFLQVALEQSIGCAAGTCLGCCVAGVSGPVRVCREGPVFAADELDWDGGATP